MSLFVAGTDTGVGKTVVSALILARYAGELPLAYWKPVATGARDERDVDTVRGLAPATAEIRAEHHLLPEPLSPHLAARRAGVVIDLADLVAAARRERQTGGRALVIEGAGGLLVPLNDRPELLIDFVAELALPVLLVARSSLGTINHTLLALEALRRRGIALAGVVVNGAPNADNVAAIRRFGAVEVIGEVAPLTLSRAGVAAAATAFDPDGRLRAPLERRG